MHRGELIVAAVALVLFAVVLGVSVPAVDTPVTPEHHVEGGVAELGEELIAEYGCGACHTVPGVRAAKGKVGPYLGRTAEQRYIVGTLVNTPENLIRWIVAPQAIEPGTAMPDLGVTPEEAGHIAAYLYSLD